MRFIWLLLLTFIAAGCVHHYPVEVAGQRKNSKGEVTQQILRKTTSVDYPALTPDGRNSRTVLSLKYYFQDGVKPARKFWIGNSSTNQFFGSFLAVSNSALWVTFGDSIGWTNRPAAAHVMIDEHGKSYTSYIGNDLHIDVFDEKGFLVSRTFIILQRGEGKMLPEAEFPYNGEIKTENGNQIIVFKSPSGITKYNVLTDTVTND